MSVRSILTANGAPALKGAGSHAHGGRWWAVVVALLAVLSVIASAPAHALEGVKASHAVSQSVAVKAEPAAGMGQLNIHALPGHTCATHCAAHILAHPAILEWTSPETRSAVRWTPFEASALTSNFRFGLKRPPRV